VLSIRPVPAVDHALNLAFAPIRVVADLAAPLGWIRAERCAKANAVIAASQEQDEAEGLAVMQELEFDAMPFRSSLREGRTFVAGRVGTRVRGKKDSVYLAIDDLSGIEVGYPVVHGDTYVGRIGAIDSDSSRVIVELVTGANFFVGATVRGANGSLDGADGRRLDLIVGGLDNENKGPDYLAVHNPSVREFRPGLVEVREPDLFAETSTHLADGYLLGRLTQLLGKDGPWSIEPLRNFESGLFHLVIVLPETASRAGVEGKPSPLRDGNWRQAKLLSHGDPEAGRSGMVIGLGETHRVRPGAAVIAGARLLGRVSPTRAGSPWTSRVDLLSEPGFAVNAVARIDEGEHGGEARVLGRLVSLGRREGGIAFQWRAAVRLDGKSSDGADPSEQGVWGTVFTGTGLDDVPGGLYIGRSLLPLSTGYHEILLTESSLRGEAATGTLPSRIFARVAASATEVSK
jgi:cell shape-determining protein MreC